MVAVENGRPRSKPRPQCRRTSEERLLVNSQKSLFSSYFRPCGFSPLTHIWRSPRWSRPRPLPGALVRLLVCLPQKSWPLISQEFLEEAVVRDDSARPCSAFHLSSASALSSLPHLLPYCILLILLYSASLFLSGHPLNRSSILSLFILSSERCVWDDLCVCVCLREGRRPNNVCRKIL